MKNEKRLAFLRKKAHKLFCPDYKEFHEAIDNESIEGLERFFRQNEFKYSGGK